jgi:hypothetical protein
MPLINCPDCSSRVSDTALKCPQCGVQLRKPKRGALGKLFKWSFILFNALMLFWLVAGFNAASEKTQALTGAEQAGAAIGTGIAVTLAKKKKGTLPFTAKLHTSCQELHRHSNVPSFMKYTKCLRSELFQLFLSTTSTTPAPISPFDQSKPTTS